MSDHPTTERRNFYGRVHGKTLRPSQKTYLAEDLARLSLSVTGVAGPGGGSADKPVGMVCFGWAQAGGPARALTRRFDGDRASVRLQAALFALQGAWDMLSD